MIVGFHVSHHLLLSFSLSMVCIGGWNTSLYSRGPFALLVWRKKVKFGPRCLKKLTGGVCCICTFILSWFIKKTHRCRAKPAIPKTSDDAHFLPATDSDPELEIDWDLLGGESHGSTLLAPRRAGRGGEARGKRGTQTTVCNQCHVIKFFFSLVCVWDRAAS